MKLGEAARLLQPAHLDQQIPVEEELLQVRRRREVVEALDVVVLRIEVRELLETRLLVRVVVDGGCLRPALLLR